MKSTDNGILEETIQMYNTCIAKAERVKQPVQDPTVCGSHVYSMNVTHKMLKFKQYLFPNKYLHMATHIDTNTWKMDQKTSYLKLI